MTTKQQALLNKRQIFIKDNDINDEAMERVAENLLYLAAISDDPITLYINSGGGDGESARMLYGIIANLPAPVHGIVIGKAHSAAFVILQACAHRAAYPYAKIMHHIPGIISGERITEEDAKKTFKDYNCQYEILLAQIHTRTKQPKRLLKQWFKNEHEFSAHEALKYNFIDEVIKPRTAKRGRKK